MGDETEEAEEEGLWEGGGRTTTNGCHTVGYNNLAFAVLTWGYLSVILGSSSSYSSTGDGTAKDTVEMGEA